MSLDTARLTRALQSSIAVDEFIVSESRARVAVEELATGVGGQEFHPHSLEARLYIDRKRGRGTASLVPVKEQELSTQVQDAVTRAFGALGAAWQLPAPAAPARVAMHDASASHSPRETARQLVNDFAKALPSSVSAPSARVRVAYNKRRAVLSNSFDNQYESTEITVEATIVATGGVPVPLLLRRRRLDDLDLALAVALERAQKLSLDGAQATFVEPGIVDLALLGSAYLPETPEDFGLWTPLVRQASARRLRAGMSTHAPGRPLLVNPIQGDALRLESVGTRPYGLRSAPFAADGQAVRNFSLVESNVATGVSVNHQESALGAGPANGGVRQLIVGAGKSSAEQLSRPGSRPLLLVHRLSAVRAVGPRALYLEIASGELRRRDALGHVQKTPVHSAVVCGDLYRWLEDAHFSRETTDENWQLGPEIIRFNNVRAH